MRILAVITTLFLPLTFLSGFFGMNFFEPVTPMEAWTGRQAFTLLFLAMTLLPLGMYIWMRQRRWM